MELHACCRTRTRLLLTRTADPSITMQHFLAAGLPPASTVCAGKGQTGVSFLLSSLRLLELRDLLVPRAGRELAHHPRQDRLSHLAVGETVILLTSPLHHY